MRSRYVCAHLTAVALSAPAAISAPKLVPYTAPPLTSSKPVPVSALHSILLTKDDLRAEPRLRKVVFGPDKGMANTAQFTGFPGALLASRSWTARTASDSFNVSVVVALTANRTQAARAARYEAGHYADIFFDVTRFTPLAKFADVVWYPNDYAKTVRFHMAQKGAPVVDGFDPRGTIYHGCIVFCRANVAVRIDMDRSDGFHPSELFALGARVARRIDRAAKEARPATTAKPAPAKRP